MKSILNVLGSLFLCSILSLLSCGTESLNPKKVPEWDEKVTEAVLQSVDDMKTSGWSPSDPSDKGSFGKEVHRRAGVLLHDGKQFLSELWVRETATAGTWEIVGMVSQPGDVTGLINLDVARMRNKSAGWTIGDTFTSDDVFRAYEIKTSVDGKVPQAQQARYAQVVGSIEKCRTAVPPERWSFAEEKFIKNPVYGSGLKTWARVAGLSTIGAFAVLNSFEARDRLEDLTQRLADTSKLIKAGELSDTEGCVEVIQCQQAAMAFIQTIDITGNSNLPAVALTYVDMAAFSRDYGAACVSLGYITP